MSSTTTSPTKTKKAKININSKDFKTIKGIWNRPIKLGDKRTNQGYGKESAGTAQ